MQHLALTETKQAKQGFYTLGSQLRVSPGINKRNIWFISVMMKFNEVLVMKKESQNTALRDLTSYVNFRTMLLSRSVAKGRFKFSCRLKKAKFKPTQRLT